MVTEITEREETNLLSDTMEAIRNQRERDAEANGKHYASGFEAYSVLLKSLEDKNDASKERNKSVKELWSGIKTAAYDAASAYLQEIRRAAMESAMAWITVAAIAGKADDSL